MKRVVPLQSRRRQARLRQEYADRYPGIPCQEWRPVAEMIDSVMSARLREGRRSGDLLRARELDDRHFEFRGGYHRPPGRHTRLMDVDAAEP